MSQSNQARADGLPPYANEEMDEGIGMDDGNECVLPGIEDPASQPQSFIGPLRPDESGWSFNRLPQGMLERGIHAPPGSDAGNESDNTLDGAASDQPAVSNEDLDSKMQDDFSDDPDFSISNGQVAHVPPTQDGFTHQIDPAVLGERDQDSEGEVAEVRLSPSNSEEGS